MGEGDADEVGDLLGCADWDGLAELLGRADCDGLAAGVGLTDWIGRADLPGDAEDFGAALLLADGFALLTGAGLAVGETIGLAGSRPPVFASDTGEYSMQTAIPKMGIKILRTIGLLSVGEEYQKTFPL